MTSKLFYQAQAQAYFEQTFWVDPSSFLQPLVKHLDPGARILDIGCGAGRDMLWLQNRGFSCIGLDLSLALASLARQHSDLPVIVADFEDFNFSRSQMDALLLVGALAHVPHKRFKQVFWPMLQGLKARGLVLITLKKGQNAETRPDGRVFYLWKSKDLVKIFADFSLGCLEYFEQQSRIRSKDTWMSFVLQQGSRHLKSINFLNGCKHIDIAE